MSQGRGMGEQVKDLGEQLVTLGNFGGTKRDLGKHCICHGSVMSKLALDCLVNSCKIAFGSFIDEILSLSLILLKCFSLS
jgi:hypothetical protein